MSTRADAANRVVLFLLGLLLAAAGGLGLALSVGAFGDARATSPVLPDNVRTFPATQPWFWWAMAGAALLIALLALMWLMAQLRTSRVARLDLTTDAREGYTTLNAGAVTQAVEEEIDAVPGVTRASARILHRPRRRLSLTVGMTDTVDIERLRTVLEEDVVAHVREAVDDPALPVEIELRPDVRHTPARTVR
jgi:hypothetical protein